MKAKLKVVIISCLFSTFFLNCQAQELRRKASLGIMFEPANDSIARVNSIEPNTGLFISKVLPSGTAANLGLQANDVLLELNEVPVNSIPGLLNQLGAIRADDDLTMVFVRRGQKQTAKGKAIPKPLEKSDYGEVEYSSVKYAGNHLRTIMHLPIGIQQPPVVFYIQGYVCQSVELTFAPDHTIKKLIDDWVKAGFAVYRVEKPGEGDSESDKPCRELNFEEEVEAFKHAYENLKKNKRIDAENIFVFGHSIGGIIAPVLASEYKPKGVITYGTVMNTWFEYLQELTRVQGGFFNSPDTVIEIDIRNATPFWYKMLVEKKSNEEILKDSSIYQMLELEGTLDEFKNGQHIGRHYTYWSGIQDNNLSQKWTAVKSKVLAIHGEFDIQALNANHIYTIERTVNKSHPGNAKAKVILGADHSFVEFESMQENVNVLSSGAYGGYLRENYHSGVATESISWMRQCIEK